MPTQGDSKVEIREINRKADNVAFIKFTWEVLAKEFKIPPYTEDTFKYFLKKYGAFVENKIIASCGIEKRPKESFVRLCYVGVTKEWRHNRIGERICFEALSFAKKSGYDLCLIDARLKSMDFYGKFNPVHTGEIYSKATGKHEWLKIDLKNWQDKDL